MSTKNLPNSRLQRGFTLVEMGIVAIIMGMMMAIGFLYASMEMGFSVADAQADQLRTLNNAVITYETTYYQNLVNNQAIALPAASGGGNVANIMSPTVSELSKLGVLDAGFTSNNLYKGGYGIQISKTPSTCSGSGCDLVGLTYLTSRMLDTKGLEDDASLGEAARRIGGDAAFSSLNNGSTLVAIKGVWSMPNPLGNVSGILAMRSGYGSSGYNQYLRRDGTQPMTGDLNMGGQNVNNANGVNSNTVNTGTLTATTANATTVNATTVNSTNGTFLNTLTAKFLSVTGSITNSGGYTGVGDIATNGNITALQNISSNGKITGVNLQSNGRLYAQEYIQLNGVALLQTYCPTNGLMAQDGNGVLMTCQKNVWTEAGHPSVPLTCSTPWGVTVASGQSVVAWQNSTVPYGSSCVSEARTCNNGTLSGSYGNQSCTVQQPAGCYLPWGGFVSSGSSTTAFYASSAPAGSSCLSQQRVCNNGYLAGSYTNPSCSVQAPAAPYSFKLSGYECNGTPPHGTDIASIYKSAFGRCSEISGYSWWLTAATQYNWTYQQTYDQLMQGAGYPGMSLSQIQARDAAALDQMCQDQSQWAGAGYQYQRMSGNTCIRIY